MGNNLKLIRLREKRPDIVNYIEDELAKGRSTAKISDEVKAKFGMTVGQTAIYNYKVREFERELHVQRTAITLSRALREATGDEDAADLLIQQVQTMLSDNRILEILSNDSLPLKERTEFLLKVKKLGIEEKKIENDRRKLENDNIRLKAQAKESDAKAKLAEAKLLEVKKTLESGEGKNDKEIEKQLKEANTLVDQYFGGKKK